MAPSHPTSAATARHMIAGATPRCPIASHTCTHINFLHSTVGIIASETAEMATGPRMPSGPPKPGQPIGQTAIIDQLWPFLPPVSTPGSIVNPDTVFVTTTFAISLDGQLSAYKAKPTSLSGPETKSLTGLLRLAHDGILIGVGTALADNPRLICTYPVSRHLSGRLSVLSRPMLSAAEHVEDEMVVPPTHHQPRPIIVDPTAKWNAGLGLDLGSTVNVTELARAGVGKSPLVLVGADASVSQSQQEALESVKGEYVRLLTQQNQPVYWDNIVSILASRQIASVMVEGGASILESILVGRPGAEPWKHRVNSAIVTIAPVWVGRQGAGISLTRHVCQTADRPDGEPPRITVRQPVWLTGLGNDAVICGHGLD